MQVLDWEWSQSSFGLQKEVTTDGNGDVLVSVETRATARRTCPKCSLRVAGCVSCDGDRKFGVVGEKVLI